MSSFLVVESGGVYFILFYLFYSYPQNSQGTPLNLGREPLGFLSPVVALVTIFRKGDETHHSMLSKNEVSKVSNSKQMYQTFMKCVQASMLPNSNEIS